MANFHTNNLVITANEEDMKKVLARIAMNLAANEEHTHFSIDEIAGLNTAKELYHVVAPVVDAYYIFAFSGAPVPEDVTANAAPGWTTPTSSEAGFLEQLQAMIQATERFNENAPEGLSVELIATEPVGRAMSDSADISLRRYGENWVLTIDYSTAWSSNCEDIDEFFMGLPTGNYGIAFYDADEYDGYRTISVLSGLHHGCDCVDETDDDYESENATIENSELKERKLNYAGISKSSVTDLAKLAKITATCGWTQFGWDDFEDGDYGDDDECDENADFVARCSDFERIPTTIWENPQESDLKEIDKLILSAVGSFPWCYDVCHGFSSQGTETAEHLFPGDAVTVVSDWSTPEYPGRVFFHVLDDQGTQLAIIESWIQLYGDWQRDLHSSAALACLLPHLTATVDELVPVSLRSKNVAEPKLSIRFDIEPIDFETLLTQTHALLEKDPEERTLSSKGKE